MVRTNSEQQLPSTRLPSASVSQKEAALQETAADMPTEIPILGIQLTSEFKHNDLKKLSAIQQDPKTTVLGLLQMLITSRILSSNNSSSNSSHIMEQIITTLGKKTKRKKRENKWITTTTTIMVRISQ